MGDKNTTGTNIKNINKELHTAIKLEAIKRGIKLNDLYLKIIQSGAKGLKIIN